MSFSLVAIDLGKRSFHLHGVSDEGIVLSRKISRAKLLGAVAELSPVTVAMEACPSAHYMGRFLREAIRCG
jgi:transposase